MALITCPECGKQISDKSEKCPQCGFVVNLSSNQNEGKTFSYGNTTQYGSTNKSYGQNKISKISFPALKTIVVILYCLAILEGISILILVLYIIEGFNGLQLPSFVSSHLYLLIIIILFFGGLSILVLVARAEMIRVYLDLDETVNDQIVLQEETNRLLQELVKFQTPANSSKKPPIE